MLDKKLLLLIVGLALVFISTIIKLASSLIFYSGAVIIIGSIVLYFIKKQNK